MAIRPLTSLRIIGGALNGRKIRIPASEGLRPSSSRLREALFNCLNASGTLSGLACLDLFAGSGVLGLSAASHGAARVTFVEKKRHRAAALKQIADSLVAPAEVLAMPAEQFLSHSMATQTVAQFDVVFLDPPFTDYATAAGWQRLLSALAPRLAANARVYCEQIQLFCPPAGWQRLTARRTGRVHWQILQPKA